MIVTRKNIFTGKVRELELNITQEQIHRWRSGELIQNVFPDLSTDEREFLISGLLPDEWERWVVDGDSELMEEDVRDDFVYDV